MATKKYKSTKSMEWRAKKKALGLCQWCGEEPVYTLRRRGKETKIFSKCKLCLRKSALLQADYREKKKKQESNSNV